MSSDDTASSDIAVHTTEENASASSSSSPLAVADSASSEASNITGGTPDQQEVHAHSPPSPSAGSTEGPAGDAHPSPSDAAPAEQHITAAGVEVEADAQSESGARGVAADDDPMQTHDDGGDGSGAPENKQESATSNEGVQAEGFQTAAEVQESASTVEAAHAAMEVEGDGAEREHDAEGGGAVDGPSMDVETPQEAPASEAGSNDGADEGRAHDADTGTSTASQSTSSGPHTVEAAPQPGADKRPASAGRRVNTGLPPPRRSQRFPPNSRVFIGNLASESIAPRDLVEIFKRYGNIIEEPVVRRSFGFVQYDCAESAARAIEAEQGRDIGGMRIDMSIADNRPSRTAQQREERRRQSRKERRTDHGPYRPPPREERRPPPREQRRYHAICRVLYMAREQREYARRAARMSSDRGLPADTMFIDLLSVPDAIDAAYVDDVHFMLIVGRDEERRGTCITYLLHSNRRPERVPEMPLHEAIEVVAREEQRASAPPPAHAQPRPPMHSVAPPPHHPPFDHPSSGVPPPYAAPYGPGDAPPPQYHHPSPAESYYMGRSAPPPHSQPPSSYPPPSHHHGGAPSDLGLGGDGSGLDINLLSSLANVLQQQGASPASPPRYPGAPQHGSSASYQGYSPPYEHPPYNPVGAPSYPRQQYQYS